MVLFQKPFVNYAYVYQKMLLEDNTLQWNLHPHLMTFGGKISRTLT